MAAIVHSVEISRPPEDVFARLTDLPRFSEWQEGLISARPEREGPMRVGSKAKMTRRVGGRERTVTTEVTEYSPPRSYAFRGIDGPIPPIGKGTVEPAGEDAGSRVTFELDFKGYRLGKLLVPLVRKQARRDLPKSYENLKQQLESSAA